MGDLHKGRPWEGGAVQMHALVPFDTCGVLVGLILLLFGYRFYKPTLFLGGFTFCGAMTFELVSQAYSPFTTYGSAVSAGIIGGTIAVYAYPLGVFTIGGLWGISLTLLLNGLFLSRVGYVMGQSNVLLWIAGCILGPLFGALALVVHRHKENDSATHPRKVVIFGKTATTGAYMFVRSVAALAGDFPAEMSMAKTVSLPATYYVCAVSILVLALLGVFIQMRYTHFEHCGCGEEYEQLEQTQAPLV